MSLNQYTMGVQNKWHKKNIHWLNVAPLIIIRHNAPDQVWQNARVFNRNSLVWFCALILAQDQLSFVQAELQIRGSIEDNSEKIFLISQQKHIL